MGIRDWVDAHESADNDLIPASTVVVLRDGPDGLETLMLRRNPKLSFAEGMWVFPGGRIDEADYGGGDDEAVAARTAAAREAKEEGDLDIDVADLVHYAHWLPPTQAPKRFSTWFFLAAAKHEALVTVDQGEIFEDAWWRPADALQRAQDRKIEILPPTWMTLFDLEQFATVAEALDAARTRDVRLYATKMMRTTDGIATVWEGDTAFETGDVDAEGPRHRLVVLESGFRFEFTS